MEKTSRIQGFYKLPLEERRRIVCEWAGLSEEECRTLGEFGNLPVKIGDSMIENVVGAMSYPFAVATNFLINGRDYLVPMVIEETSVVAAASNAARMLRHGKGILANAERQEMISQIHLVKVNSPRFKAMKIIEAKKELLDYAAQQDPTLLKYGGGPRDLEVRVMEHPALGGVIIVHLVVDVRDAMGANTVNTMAEAIAPLLEKITGGEARLRIVSNHAVYRVARAWAATPVEEVGGLEVARKIMEASMLAEIDPYRAVTHNKGIMNGVIAVALATGQDHRAIEAGAHAYASRTGVYKSLSYWEVTSDNYLAGSLEIPLQIGVVGGAVKVHPVAKIALKILGVNTARELAEVMAAVGLAQNLAALRALVTEGIQKGHMRLHARNLAIMAGASGDLIDKVAEKMIRDGRIRYDYAKQLVEKALQGEPLD
ncbi:MAG: hydroxymethylglutaryl-CoA reductase, degradative [Desulfurococcus sp.]|jgi:hydroxymethylglutaryl-CoA reductase|uniref:hydroxymethylglutaryl-CoA reductase, degradative n=1 Tax=Desulfurococcus sp. TaxID=51678 RepID=UPI003163B8FF